MNPNTNEPAVQPDDATKTPVPGKARRPRRMARGADAAQEPPAPPAAPRAKAAPRGPSKIASVITLLRREQGATLAELIEATGWLPHTTRAALTGLRKKGHVIDKTAREGTTVYSIAGAA